MHCDKTGVHPHKTRCQLTFLDQLIAQVLLSYTGEWNPKVFSVQEQVVPATPIRSLG